MQRLIDIDIKIFDFLHSVIGKSAILDSIWSIIAVYFIYLLPVFLVINWFANPKSRAVSVRAAVVGVIGWQVISPLISLLWYRERPFVDSAISTQELIFHRPTYSFPSDHSLFAFALASGFYFAGHKKVGIVLYVVAFLIAFSRIVTGVHFPLDILVGAAIGIFIAWLAYKYRSNLDPYIVKPFLKIAQFIKLDK